MLWNLLIFCCCCFEGSCVFVFCWGGFLDCLEVVLKVCCIFCYYCACGICGFGFVWKVVWMGNSVRVFEWNVCCGWVLTNDWFFVYLCVRLIFFCFYMIVFQVLCDGYVGGIVCVNQFGMEFLSYMFKDGEKLISWKVCCIFLKYCLGLVDVVFCFSDLVYWWMKRWMFESFFFFFDLICLQWCDWCVFEIGDVLYCCFLCCSLFGDGPSSYASFGLSMCGWVADRRAERARICCKFVIFLVLLSLIFEYGVLFVVFLV